MSDDEPIRFLNGSRLYLRKPAESDLPLFLRWINDPDTWHWLGRVSPMNMTDEKAWFEALENGNPPTNFVFTIVLEERDEPIGVMGLHAVDWINRRGTTGSLLGEERHRGRGYGLEAKRLLLRYAFETLGLNRVNSSAIAYNHRSRRHLEKVGYVLEGRRRKAWFRNGEWHDELIFGILAEDWRGSD